MKFSRLLTTLLSIVLCASLAMAQKAADNLYNQGLKYQQTMTVKSQKMAIDKFKQAKAMYDSSDKKAQCDNSIAVSNKIIKDLSPGSKGQGGSSHRSKGSSTNDYHGGVTSPTLELSNTSFEVPIEAQTITVSVVTNQDNWDCSLVAGSDGSSFLRIDKSGANEIKILVPTNNNTGSRMQKVMVTAGGLRKEIKVTQAGLPITLKASEPTINFKEKGGKKKIKITCNSSTQYANNSNENWYVESKPDWISITINEKREKGWFQKMKDKGEEIVKGKSSEEDVSSVESEITVTADAILKGSVAASKGRQGEIIIRSGDAKIDITVTQQ